MVTLKGKHLELFHTEQQKMNKIMFVTLVYAKCDAIARLALWNSLYVLADGMVAPWLIGAGFKGSPFTWWNGRSDGQCIFKRLDGMLYNNLMQQWYGLIEVDHLARTGFDHAPLLLSCNEQQHQFIRPFKFLKFWVDHESFQSVVTQNWHAEAEREVFLSFKKKVNKINVVLSALSRHVFGDIFKQLTIRKNIVRIKEQLFEESPTEVNRMLLQRAQAELKRYLYYEEEFWRQILAMIALLRGIETLDFFHNIVNGRRKRTLIRRIQNADGNWTESVNEIADEAISFYQKKFSQDSMQNFQSEMAILDHIPSMISQEENAHIVAIPTMEEVKQAVFELSGDSASGPVTPRSFSITHTNLVLLPKKNEVESFSDMRLISLSNFINKVISRVVHNKLEKALPRLISANQSGLVKGRNIIENVLLTQEIVSDIRLRDDTLVFASADAKSLELIMDTLKAYEDNSGQLINKRKSSFYMHSKVCNVLLQQVEKLTGGKAILIKSVLQSVPIHILLAIRPPKCVIKEIHQIFAKFFWSSKEDVKSRHWAAWLKICFPVEESGLGFRSLFDIAKALNVKLWWRFRTSNSLWENFLWNKYCKKQYPQYVTWKGGSQVWQMVLEARDNIEQEIWWETHSGTANIWYDNWTKLGALHYIVPNDFISDDSIEDVSHFITEDGWNEELMHHYLPEEIASHVVKELKVHIEEGQWDKP
ncbi:uncharacterized protein LOC132607933 [Lycium barbarum]|uniref:uncharacterized protein LOC132607933 n=1 Tax=Lycium barbarum TaxID=112863 RepID=UPI00293EB743|nr:uncharacterized protein LOC132607933 [Lycium barbarum]